MVLEMNTKENTLSHLKEYGWAVIENYWSKEKCDEALNQIKSIPPQAFDEWTQGGDARCQHSNRFSPLANEFMNDSFIQSIATGYGTCHVVDRTLAGIVMHQEGKATDSGGGWHVDCERETQFKAFMYLTDVSEKNGPFTFIQKSKELASSLPKHDNLRISEEAIKENVNPDDIIEFVAPAGTLIVADTTFPHRGKQIEEGSRFTITNYYYDEE